MIQFLLIAFVSFWYNLLFKNKAAEQRKAMEETISSVNPAVRKIPLSVQ